MLQFLIVGDGNTFSFKMFVLLTTGNESGGNTLTIVQP